MTEDVRWKQRFTNFELALTRLQEAVKATTEEPNNHLYQIALIGSFQFTFELAWKTLKDYLKYGGIEAGLPRDVIKQAFHYQLIKDGIVWIDMLEDRNLMAHVYQESAAITAGQNIRKRYVEAIEQVYHLLRQKQL